MSRNIPLVLASTLIVLITTPVAAFGAFNQSCDILSWNPSYPGQITAGGAVQVVSTIDIACAQWRTFYSARLDLVDRSSNDRILSTSTFQIGWLPNVTEIVSNNATAPASAGVWKLQLNLYIFEEASLVTTFKNALSINVADPVAPTQQPQAENTTTTAMLQPTSTQMAPLQTNSMPNVASTSDSWYISVVLALAALIGVSVLLAAKRLRSSTPEPKPDTAKHQDE